MIDFPQLASLVASPHFFLRDIEVLRKQLNRKGKIMKIKGYDDMNYVQHSFMKYSEQPQRSGLSCEGCVFSRQVFKKVLVRDAYNHKRKVVKDMPTGNYGCYSPDTEPYRSCREREVIFLESK